MLFSLLISAGLLSAGLPADVAEHATDTLHAVTVTADKGVVVSRTDTLSIKNSFNISDLLHQSPGLLVGDYGGLAGLKTVSLRGMGSPHTAIYIDGVRVGNVQSGQGDLGMLGIENYSAAVVDYAQNSISFNTARPVFSDSPVSGNIRFNAGSFGTYLPSARLDFRISDRISLSANATGVFSKGNFIYGDGQERTNNDLSQVRAGVDLFGLIDSGDYHVKAYYNSSDRGTPGSLSWPSEDRQKDMNAFVQGMFRKRFSPLYTLRISAKGSYDDIYYTSSWGDSQYGQTEVQINSSHVFRISRWLNISTAADLQWDKLASTNYNASRLTGFSALTASFRSERLAANIGLEYNGTFDKDALSRKAVSPSMDFRLTLTEGLDLVGFARGAYRIPMFNELYYVGYGNPDLKPEDAWLTDLGLDYNKALTSSWSLKAKIDGFYNLLTNKITSAPTAEDPNIWLPFNIGKVRSAGFDLMAGSDYESGKWACSAEVRYSYQSTVDKTPDSYTFDQQIAYIARHSVTADASVSWKGYAFNPRFMMKAGRTDSAGSLADWNTLDLNLSKTFSFGRSCNLTVNVAAKNILDSRYELVSGYPMPGRSFIGGIGFTF